MRWICVLQLKREVSELVAACDWDILSHLEGALSTVQLLHMRQ